MLVLAIAIDVRWSKWRHRLHAKVYVSPAYLALPPPLGFAAGSSSPYAINDRLSEVEIIGLGEIDGPEDVILDEAGHLYCGVRHGEIIRFFGPDYSKREVYAHVGGSYHSVWPLTGTAASMSVSPAWGCTASTKTAMFKS